MAGPLISRGFLRKRQRTDVPHRVPPGQHVVRDFPVLSAGPTPHTPLDRWTLTIEGLVRRPATWTWDDFLQLPAQPFVVDIHCVTKWSKLDTHWTGVSIDTLFERVERDPAALYVTAWCDGAYTTNAPVADLINGQAYSAHRYEYDPRAPHHGGPA